MSLNSSTNASFKLRSGRFGPLVARPADCCARAWLAGGGCRRIRPRPAMPTFSIVSTRTTTASIAADEVTPENRPLFERLLRRARHESRQVAVAGGVSRLARAEPAGKADRSEGTGQSAAGRRGSLHAAQVGHEPATRGSRRTKCRRSCGRFSRSCSSGSTTTTTAQLDRQELSRSGPGAGANRRPVCRARGHRREGRAGEARKVAGRGGQPVRRQPMAAGTAARSASRPARCSRNWTRTTTASSIAEGSVRAVSRAGRAVHRAWPIATATAGFREQEFVDGAERLSKFLGRQMKDERKDLQGEEERARSRSRPNRRLPTRSSSARSNSRVWHV